MKESILLSIIIPFYNADEWIGRMLDSLMDQGLAEDAYEIIIIDDGSTQDKSALKLYLDKYSNIFCYRKENGGLSSARNMGLGLARGKWLYFCDADDFIHPQALGSLLETAEDLDLEMLVCDFCVVQPDAAPIEQERPFEVSDVYTGIDYIASFAHYPMSIGFGVWRYLVKKSVISDNGLLFEDLAYIEDRLFQMDLLSVVKRLVHVKLILYYYVQRKSSLLNSKAKKYDRYAPWLWHYIERLTDSMHEGLLSSDPEVRTTLKGWRDYAIFSILMNSFRYCPVSTTRYYLDKLTSIEDAFPIENRSNIGVKFVCKCMEHRRLWLFLCRIFHLIPLKIRQLL
jgi:glycosyltransferase involved in cell wall biosynthesis